MQKEELTKRFNSAGKSLKYAGYAFLAILAVTIISTIIVFGYPEMTADKRNVIIIIGSGFFSILPFVILNIENYEVINSNYTIDLCI